MAMNPQSVLSQLRMMSDQQLQQYAAMHKNDPFVFPLAFQESQTRKQMRSESQAMQPPQPKVVDQDLAQMAPAPRMMPQQAQPLPEDVGIGALPAKNMEGMCGGGIVAFDEGGEVPRYNGKTKYGSLVQEESARLGLDPDVMMRLFGQESSWNPNAVSPRGEKYGAGIGQLSVDAAADMGLSPQDRYDPYKAIPASLGYYKRQLNKFGSNDKALAAYNWGPGNVEKHLAKSEAKGQDYRIGLPKETADYLTKILPIGSAQAAPAAGAATDKAAMIPGQSVAAPQAQPQGGFLSSDSFQRGAESLGLSRDVGRNVFNTLMAPTPLAPASQIPSRAPSLYQRAANLGESIYNRFVPTQGLSKEGIAALRAESELARKVTPEAQLLLTGPQAKLPGTTIPVTQAGEGITNLVQPARMVPPAADASRLEQMAAAANARKAAQAAQGADTGAAATRVAQEVSTGKSAAEKIQEASMLREAQEAAALSRAANAGQAAKTGAALASAGATAASGMDMSNPFGDIDLGATDASLGAASRDLPLSDADKTALKDAGKDATKASGLNTKGWTSDDFIAMGLGILSGQSPNTLTNIGEGGLKGLAMRQARIKEEADTAYKEALAKHYGVDPFLQRLNALKDPENVKLYQKMKDLEREPMTREALFKQFIARPENTGLSQKDLRDAFRNYIQLYESELGPIGGLPPGVITTRTR